MTIESRIYHYKDKFLDINYGEKSDYQKMDIIRPNDIKEKLPAIIYVHGGSWISGDKRSSGKYFTFDIPKYGYVLASINYRLAPEGKWSEQLDDIKSAVKHIRNNHEKYAIDPDRIYIWGDSAGGHLAQLAALTARDGHYESFDGVVSFYGVSDLLCMDEDAKNHCMNWGAVSTLAHEESPICKLIGGVIEGNEFLTAEAEKASPINNIDKNSCKIPFLLQHGNADKEVYYMQSVRMAEKLKEICPGADVVLEIFEGEDHSSPKIKSEENIQRCIDFLDKYAYDGKNPYR